MGVIIERIKLPHPYSDKKLYELVNSEDGKFHPSSNKTLYPEIYPSFSGRAIRSTLLNAPNAYPELNTSTFDYVVNHYSATALYPIYHGMLMGNPQHIREIQRKPLFQFANYKYRKWPLMDTIAALYLLYSLRDRWNFKTEDLVIVDDQIAELKNAIRGAFARLSHADSSLDPVRLVYNRTPRSSNDGSFDTIVAVDDVVMTKYLAEGYTENGLLSNLDLSDPKRYYTVNV